MKTRVNRVRSWRDVEPSCLRGFVFTLRVRPGLAVRWAVARWVCRPWVRGVRALRRAVARGWVWLEAGVLSPARSVARARRAWGRVELARNFRAQFNVNGNGGVR